MCEDWFSPVSVWVGFIFALLRTSVLKILARVNVFVAAYVYALLLHLVQPVCIHMCMCWYIRACVCAHVCVSSLISSVPSGQFWHLERTTLCIPHGSVASSSELEMGLWYVEMIFLNTTNLSFSLSLNPPLPVTLLGWRICPAVCV